MDKVNLLINPTAGQGRAAHLEEAFLSRLASLDLSVNLHRSEGAGHATSLARELCEKSRNTLVVAGGDGTLFEVINGYLQTEGPLPDLALVPLGSGNDFAKSLGIPLEWADACDRLRLGTKRRVDVGQCDGLFFLNSLGIGLDAEIARASHGKRWIPRPWRYHAALLHALIRTGSTRIKGVHDHGEFEEDLTLLMIGNGGFEGGYFHLAPQADIEDGKLDLVLAPALTRRDIIKLLPKVEAGEVEAIPGYQHFQTRRVKLNFPVPVCVHADGEILYHRAKRLEIGVLPGAVTFLS